MKIIPTRHFVPPRSNSALGRPLDPRFASNRFVAVAALAVGLAFAASTQIGSGLPTSAVAAAVSVFLAWAIGREIDPDRNISAIIAMGVAGVAAIVTAPSLLFGFGVLIGTRLISGTVGLGLKPLDMAVLVALGGVLGSSWASVAALPVVMVGILVIERRPARRWPLALTVGGAGLAVLAVRQPELAWNSPALPWLAAALAVGVAVWRSWRANPPTTQTDTGVGSLSAWRISLARVAAAAAVIVSLATAGQAGLEASLGTAVAAIVGVAIARVFPNATLFDTALEQGGEINERDSFPDPHRAERMLAG